MTKLNSQTKMTISIVQKMSISNLECWSNDLLMGGVVRLIAVDTWWEKGSESVKKVLSPGI